MAIAGPPALQGTRLCFTDDRATVCMYDTGEAPDGTPVHRWTYALPTIASGEYRLPQPVVSGDRVYAAWWTYDTSNHQQRLYLVTLDAATGAGPAAGPAAVTAIDAATASGQTFWFDILGDLHADSWRRWLDGSQTRAVLFVNGGNTVWRIDVGAPNPALSYHLTGYQRARSPPASRTAPAGCGSATAPAPSTAWTTRCSRCRPRRCRWAAPEATDRRS